MQSLTFGQWMRQRRLERRLTPSDCADRANMKLPVWSNWENDRSRRKDGRPAEPRYETLKAIARALECPVEDVMEAAGVKPVSVDPAMPFFRDLDELINRAPAEKRSQIREGIRRQAETLVLLAS